MDPVIVAYLRERLREEIRVPALGPCWICTLANDKDGYCRFRRQGKSLMVHRAVWELVNGPIPDGKCVCHSCDSPPCCNPDHLWLGSHTDNMRDMQAKGRAADWVAVRACLDRVLRQRGVRGGAAKLTDARVREIRALSAEGVCNADLAARYGVRKNTISTIIHRKSWAWVD